jgi:AcrR family transcriptional regulator
MERKHTSKDTKVSILQAAREIMIQKGFDGTKMEDIAGKAGVNKVMLYYHFQSKDNILRELIGNIIGEAKKDLAEGIEGLKKQKTLNPEIILEKLKLVIGGEASFIRIILSEVLRGKIDYGIILSLLRDFYDEIYNMRKNAGGTLDDRETYITKMLFFQGLPLIMFYCISEDVGKVYGIGYKKMEKAFSDKFSENLLRTLNLI